MNARDIDWTGVAAGLHAAASPRPTNRRRLAWMAGNSHFHSYTEVVICISGAHEYGVAGGVVEMQPGTLCVLPPRCSHDANYGTHHRRCVDLWMHFLPGGGALTLNLIEHDARRHTTPWPLPMPGMDVARDAMRAVELIGNAGDRSDLPAEANFFFLYFGVLICRYLATAGTVRTDCDQLAVIRHVKAYVQENLGDDLNLEHLAKVAGYSPFHFHRLFQRVEGVTLRSFVECERLNLAQKLLRQGMSVTAAAHEAGFDSSSQFARVFRRRMGVTPSRWLVEQEM